MNQLKYGFAYQSWKTGRNKKMEVILREDELKKAVEIYLKPRMSHHDIESVCVREVKVNNEKRLEIIATIKEKEGVDFVGNHCNNKRKRRGGL